LSALPLRLREQASVYALTDQGFELTRRSDGPFTCIVERNHARSIIPQCVDAAGADTVIPGIILKTNWVAEGVSLQERQSRYAVLADKGELKAPPRPGINYMMSDYNYIWNARAGELMRVPPHVMFYAPGLTNEDIGGSMEQGMRINRGVPFIVQSGIHGYITSMVERAADPAGVIEACAGELPAVAAVLGE
ncbi:MAG: hypothetical protein AAF184_25315, partial [Pseudomonadota bacterium]